MQDAWAGRESIQHLWSSIQQALHQPQKDPMLITQEQTLDQPDCGAAVAEDQHPIDMVFLGKSTTPIDPAATSLPPTSQHTPQEHHDHLVASSAH